MKNPELMALIAEHGLTSKKISALIDVPEKTVNNWRRSPESPHSRSMKASNLKLLKMVLDK